MAIKLQILTLLFHQFLCAMHFHFRNQFSLTFRTGIYRWPSEWLKHKLQIQKEHTAHFWRTHGVRKQTKTCKYLWYKSATRQLNGISLSRAFECARVLHHFRATWKNGLFALTVWSFDGNLWGVCVCVSVCCWLAKIQKISRQAKIDYDMESTLYFCCWSLGCSGTWTLDMPYNNALYALHVYRM